jgi:hypothetical protein
MTKPSKAVPKNAAYTTYTDDNYDMLTDLEGVRMSTASELNKAEIPIEVAAVWCSENLDSVPELIVKWQEAKKEQKRLDGLKPLKVRPPGFAKKDNKEFGAVLLVAGSPNKWFGEPIFSEQAGNILEDLPRFVDLALQVEQGKHDNPDFDRRAGYRTFTDAKSATALAQLDRLKKLAKALADCDLAPLAALTAPAETEEEPAEA